ncbi:MAG TPA: hypothetical protein VKF81_10215 [Blastocatellia bacterium]|nr:hypothetical protein [Blastocatellia bacterium]
MSEERIVQLLEQIRDLEDQHLKLSKENTRIYDEAVEANQKALRRGKKVQVAFFVIMLLFLLFVIYAEWFANGIPQPSWMK